MKKFIKVLAVLILVGAVGYGIYWWFFTGANRVVEQEEIVETAKDEVLETEKEEKIEEVKKPEIEIFKGNDRPIAFMIDNNKIPLSTIT